MWQELLERLRASGELVDVRRDELPSSDIRGFVVATSPEHVLMQVANGEVKLTGHSVIRMRDVAFVRWGTGVQRAWRALLEPERQGGRLGLDIDLSDWASIIRSVSERGNIMTYHREGVDHHTCYIGRNAQCDGGLLSAEQVSIEGEVDGHFAIRLGDLTRLDFGGSYEAGLERLLARRA